MAKVKTIYRQIDQLFSMSRSFGQKKKELKKAGQLDAAITGAATYDIYRAACMRFAKDLAERRGTTKFQICSVTSEEVRNFLERIKQIRRPETVHQYSSALEKLEKMTNKWFGRVSWKIEEFERPRRSREDVTVQRGPAYTPEEADRLIQELRKINPRAGDALEFIRATGCRAESIFGTALKKGNKTYRDFSKAITAERINLQKRTVTLIEKGGKVREVRYDGQFHNLMQRLVQEASYGGIFAGINQQTIYSQIKMIAEKSSFSGRGLHGMRKTFAVQRHKEYISRINELVKAKDWQRLAEEFSISEQKARRMCKNPLRKVVDVVARLRLTRDLGHNRVEVTYRYVPRGKRVNK
ncbi:hypothetical protein [Desulforamulus putei]|uniref:hypothetical protein n=1 Tax=Desulforamulus putei TaxID=74701 RepID=UPI002FDCBD66